MGCGGRGSVGRESVSQGGFPCERSTARKTNGAVAYGKTVWSWHPLLVPSWRRRSQPNRARSAANSPMTETRRIRRRGERGISRKAIAQGMPECFRWTCMLVCVFLPFCTRDRGCSVHPAFPAPSFRGEKIHANLGRIAPREREASCMRSSFRGDAKHRTTVRTLDLENREELHQLVAASGSHRLRHELS